MYDPAKSLFTKSRKAHKEIYEELVRIKVFIKQCGRMEEQADVAYAANEAFKLLDDLRKEAQVIRELAEKIGTALWVKVSNGDPIRTDYVTATPRVKMTATLPKKSKDPVAYATFMRFLKIPEDIADAEVVRPHWPAVVELLSKLMEEGKPLPPGIDPDKMYPVYKMTLRGKAAPDAE